MKKTRHTRLIKLGSSNKFKNRHIMKNSIMHIERVNEETKLKRELEVA